MPVEIFTKEQFEKDMISALHPFGVEVKHVNGYAVKSYGEHVYYFILDCQTAVCVRSSVDIRSGVSDGTGENSIRFWMINRRNGKMVSKLPIKYITRVRGWQDRLVEKVLEMKGYREQAGDCPQCNNPKSIYATKKGDNKGRIFTKCFDCNRGFEWLN